MSLSRFTESLPEKQARKVIQTGFTVMLVVIAFLVIFGLNRIANVHESLVNIVNNEQVTIEILFHMQRISHDRSVALYRISATQDMFERDEAVQRYNNLGYQFGQDRHKLGEFKLDALEQALLAQQKNDAVIATNIQNQMISLAVNGQMPMAQEMLNKQAIPVQDKVLASINTLLEHEMVKSHEDMLLVKRQQWRASFMLIIGGIVAVLFVWMVARFVRRRMGKLIEDIAVAAEKLKNTNMQLEFIQHAVDAHNIVSVSDVQGNITYVNDLFCQVSQYSRSELMGKNHRLLKSSMQSDEFYDELWHTISSGKVWQGELCNRNKAGGHYWVATTIVPMMDAHGLPSQYISVRTEITAIKDAQQILLRSKEELEVLVQERTAELQEKQDVLHSITNAAQDAVIMIDHLGNVAYWNPAAEKMFGYMKDEILGRSLHDKVVPVRYLDTYHFGFNQFSESGSGALIGATTEVNAVRRDGSEFPVEISISGVKLKGHWHAVAIVRDITARKLADEQLIKLATTDALTGIYNRRRFNEVIKSEISRANRYQKQLGLLIFDIDYFKRINDKFGHQVGDEVLIRLTSLVIENLRDTDVFARWGGEEFTVLAPNCDEACALQLAEKLRIAIEHDVFPSAGKVTCSFGVTNFRDSDDEEIMLKRADDGFYRAKQAGRNRVEFV